MRCEFCGEEIPEGEEHEVIDGHFICRGCYDDHGSVGWQICDKCGVLRSADDDFTTVVTGDGCTGEYCESCFQKNSVVRCDQCYAWMDIEECGESNNGEYLCDDCIGSGWGFCENCGHITDDLDCGGYCSDCRGADEDRSIHDYGYTPELEFWGTEQEPPGKHIYLGFELEVDVASRDDIHEDGECVAEAISEQGVCWCTEDGSLCYGFELTTHPMTLRYHKTEDLWPWRLKRLVSGGWRSYDVSSCGFHVHVNRDVLCRDTWIAMSDWIQEEDIRKLLRKVSQRKSNYANFYDMEAEEQHCDIEQARNNIINGWRRYAAMNFENSGTIEFRVFKGSLKYERVLSYLEFVDAIVRYFKVLENINFEVQPKYADFVQFIKDNPDDYGELIQKLKDKGFIPTEESAQLCLM